MSERRRGPRGPIPVVSNEAVLSEILKRTRTAMRGARIEDLIPTFDNHRSTAFARFRALRKAGLIMKIPGTKGEYCLTEAGLIRHAQHKQKGK